MTTRFYQTNRRHIIAALCCMLVLSLGEYFHSDAYLPYQFETGFFLALVGMFSFLVRRIGVDRKGVFVACYVFGKVLWEVKRFPFEEVVMVLHEGKKTVVLLTTKGKISGRIRGRGRLEFGRDTKNRRELLEQLVTQIPKNQIAPEVIVFLDELKEK